MNTGQTYAGMTLDEVAARVNCEYPTEWDSIVADLIGRIRSLESEGSDTIPYWAHHAMAYELAKHGRPCPLGSDPCTSTGLCITEYCPSCYAKVWWGSKHKAQKKRAKQ